MAGNVTLVDKIKYQKDFWGLNKISLKVKLSVHF